MIKSFTGDERGAIVVAFAFAAAALVTIGGAAIEYSRLSSARTELQVRVDAAALAGALRAAQSHGSSHGARERDAVEAASAVLGPTDGNPTVTASIEAREVRVAARADVPLFFGRLVGMATGSVDALAVASFDIARPACVLALGAQEPIGVGTGGSSALRADQCTVWSNSASTTSVQASGSSQLRGREICAVGRGGGAGASPAPESGCPPLADPFAGRELNAATTCNAPPSMSSSGRYARLPGSYCGLDLKGEVTLAPGVYTVRDGTFKITGGGSVTGDGVTILLAGSAALDWSGSPRIRLSPPASGPTAGIAIASTRDNNATSRLSGTVETDLDGEMSGSIYLPSKRLELSGNVRLRLNGARDKLVARSIGLGGRSSLTVAADDLAELREMSPKVRFTQ